jgi:predicted DCC family thiol-disulfide oxidoreductase YuxK
MDSKSQHIILFDGVCTLCNATVLFIIKKDICRLFKFSALQSDVGKKISIQFQLPEKDYASFVYFRNNKLLLRSEAALYVLKDLGYPWKGLFIFIIVPRPLRDAVYNCISKNRFRFWKRQNTCLIPTPAIATRFLS